MSNAIITTAGMALLANLQSQNQSINIDQFIYGYIENLDINSEPSANSTKPEESNIVYTATLTKVGYVDDQTIIYSNRLDTTIGDFSYNWVGLYCSDHDTLIAVSHVPTVQKKKTVNDILGNTLCKNFAIQYTSIKSLANVTIAADESQLIGDLYALTTHTHDERYPLKNHHHNELYAAINHTHDDMATGGINENILINGEGLINTYDTNKQFIHQSSRYYIDRHFWEITDEGSITWNPTTGARTVDSGGGYPWKLEQKFDAADLIKHRIYGAKATAKMACNFDHTINIVLVDNSNTETIINGTLNSDNSVTFDIPEFNSNLKTFIVRFSAETNGIITNFKLEEGDKFTGYPITAYLLKH
ncbi:phage tail protein [Lentisphaerae bacterium WC36]|nr:phage tail protein [Lentisphaerae bacterium WC36]